MATSVSYLQAYSEYRSHENFNEVFQAAINNKWSRELRLSSVKSCLTIGPGEGEREVPFIKQCAVNTSKLIAVEPDHESAERLKIRLAEDLPGVESQVFETNIENWKGMDDQVDLMLIMQVLYYIRENERNELYKKIHDQWLAPGGHVVVVSVSRAKCPGNVMEVFARLGTPLMSSEEFEAELVEAGFIKQYADEIQCLRDFSNVNKDKHLVQFLQYLVEKPVTLDEVRSIVEELFPEGKSDQLFFMLSVFQKA